MAAAEYDFIWEQGEDLVVDILYLVDDVGVDLSAPGNAVRMDIAPLLQNPASPSAAIFSLNSEDFTSDPALDVVGDADNEVTLGAAGQIQMVVGRAATLSGGAIGDQLAAQQKEFKYDIFLREATGSLQKKILKGRITINGSVTKWL